MELNHSKTKLLRQLEQMKTSLDDEEPELFMLICLPFSEHLSQ